MPLELPIYLIVGLQPVALETTASGGLSLTGWDFERGEMTREAASWDDVVATQPGLNVAASYEFSEGDLRRVTASEFAQAIEALRRSIPRPPNPVR